MLQFPAGVRKSSLFHVCKRGSGSYFGAYFGTYSRVYSGAYFGA